MSKKPGGVALRSSAELTEGVNHQVSVEQNVDIVSFNEIRDCNIFEIED